MNATPVKANLLATSAKLGFGRGFGTICIFTISTSGRADWTEHCTAEGIADCEFYDGKSVRVRFGRSVNALWLGESVVTH